MPSEKVWSFQRTDTGMRVLVNGEEILNFAPSDTYCDETKNWKTYWSHQVGSVRFYPDSASQLCRALDPQVPVATPAPTPRYTVSPPKGPWWYNGSPTPVPSEPATKHTPTRDNCWVKRVRPVRAEKILSTLWKGREECESLCRRTVGCHAVHNPKNLRSSKSKCELFGKYDLERVPGRDIWRRYSLEMAERKCFDPNHYTSLNATSPCGAFSWECSER